MNKGSLQQMLVHLTKDDLQHMIEDSVQNTLNNEIASHRLKIEASGKMLKPSEVRDRARCGNNTVYTALKSGALKSVSVGIGPRGDRKLIRQSDAELWIDNGMPVEGQA